MNQREQEIRLGKVESMHFLGCKLSLYWEVWAECPIKPAFIVELESGWGGVIRDFKQGYATLEEADAQWKMILEANAKAIAIKALGLKLDTVKIVKPPQFKP